MALNLASPGIVIREVDLTIGRVDGTSGSIGALVAPFTKGPVEEAQRKNRREVRQDNKGREPHGMARSPS